MAVVPKKCVIHAIELKKGRGRGTAEVRFSCPDDPNWFPDSRGGGQSYRSKILRGVTSVHFRGVSVSGDARLGFVLIPAKAYCSRRGREIDCKLKGNTSSPSLAGRRRRRAR